MPAHFFDTVENSVTGKPVSGASVTVLDGVDGAELTIYTDELLSVEASNPLTTDSTGFFEFYTDQDEGCLVIAYDGATYRTIENVQFLGGSVSTDLATLAARVDKHDTVFGLAASALDLGTFTGSTIADSSAVKVALQALETAVEAAALTMASTVAQSGTPVANSVGFLGSPQMADQDDYTLALTDAGGHYYHVSATPHTLTIPANSSVAFPIGTVFAIVNENGAGAITLAITTDTLRWGSSTGSRTIAANGVATLLKVTSTVWRLTGDGIT
jgi:hypothetical protein